RDFHVTGVQTCALPILEADLGNWSGRIPDEDEWEVLEACQCPACLQHDVEGLQAGRMRGFVNRATHNLRTPLEEARLIDQHTHRSEERRVGKEGRTSGQ